MNKTDKVKLGSEIKEKFLKSQLVIFADYKGLEANQANVLRAKVRGANGEVKVLKNNIARVVAKDGSLGEGTKQLLDSVVGPTVCAFSYGDPAALAKVMNEFSKDNEAFQLKESLMAGKSLKVDEIQQLANLPSREVLLARLLGQLNAPITNFVSVLAAVPRGLVTVLSAIEKKKAGGTQ